MQMNLGRLTEANWDTAPDGATNVSSDGKTFYKRDGDRWYWFVGPCETWFEVTTGCEVFNHTISKEADLGWRRYEG